MPRPPSLPTDAEIAQASLNSLACLGGGYTTCADGSLEYAGERPGEQWHIHGWFERWLWILVDGSLKRRRLRKRRWVHTQTGKTCHSRPADELEALHFCSLIVLLKIWAWLNGGAGLHNLTDVSDAFDQRPSERTLQRWLQRAIRKALEIQQAIRGALIERCEPRPVEHLFPGGLSPPESLMRRRWRNPNPVAALYRALAMLFVAAIELDIPTCLLLAEARGRCIPDNEAKKNTRS